MDKQELYQQMILSHNKKPKNYGKLENYNFIADGFNPLCGDHYRLYLLVNDNTIEEISFEGEGCAISKASASMMTESVKGKKIDEIETIFNDFHLLITGKLNPEADEHKLGKLAVFSGVCKYPSRIKCAILSWHTMKKAVNTPKETFNEEDFIKTED